VRRIAYGVAAAAVGAWLVYVLCVNALLLSGGLAWFLYRVTDDTLALDTGHSTSLWPGVVRLRQLRLEVLQRDVHVSVEIPDGRVDILLRALFRRHFDTASMSGSGVSVRVRPHFEGLGAARRAALPPLSDRTEPEQYAAPEDLWQVTIAGIHLQATELWVSELRYLGSAEIQGSFTLAPLAHLAIEPSRIALGEGALTLGPSDPVLDVRDLLLHVELSQTPLDDLPEGVLRTLEARLELRARVASLAFLGSLDASLAGLSGGAGDLTLRGALAEGRFSRGPELDYETSELGWAHSGSSAKTALALHVRVPEPPSRGDRRGSALTRVHAVFRGVRVLDQNQLWAQLEHADLDLKLVPQLGDGVWSAQGSLRFDRLGLRYREWTFEQDGKLELEGLSWLGPGHAIHASRADFDFNRVSLHHPDVSVEDWHLGVHLEQLAGAPRSGQLRAAFVASGDDARPVLYLLGVRNLPPGVSGFLAMPDLRVRGSLDLSAEMQDIRLDRAESKTIDVRGRVLRLHEDTRAALLFRATPLSLGVGVNAEKTSLTAFAGEPWLIAQLAQLDGIAGASKREATAR
jgi:hypothetical protein